jgi:hypothetical protein
MFTMTAVASGLFSARGDVIFQSATLGPLTGGGYLLGGSQYLGSRFSLTQPVQVQAIGGHFLVDGGSLFGAIVSLSSPSALPSGSPFDTTTIATVTFTLPLYEDADVSIPLSVELQPGNYALIFGSGQFGASGFGGMANDNTDIPGQASYFWWGNNQWYNDTIDNTRFVVYGEVVPEPGTIALFAMASGVIALLKWRRRKENHLSRIEKETDSDHADSNKSLEPL